MRITIFVKPRSKRESVERVESDGSYIVRVNAPPFEGKANERVCELLAEHFKCATSQVQIEKGTRGKRKVVSIR